jgi:predicted esterase
VNRFAMAEVRDAKRKERDPQRLVEMLLAEGAMRVATFSAPSFELAAEGKLEAREVAPVFALAARVHSVERDAILRVSVNGRVSVSLNGKVVHEESGDQFMLTDHRSVPVHLRAGWNELALRLEKVPPYAVALSMRLRGADHLPLTPVVWSVPHRNESKTPKVGADPCGVFAAAIERSLTAEGWTLTGVLTARGLLPWPAPKVVSLKRNGVMLAEAKFDPDQRETALSIALPADADGRIALELDGAECAAHDHVPRPDERRRYLEAAYQIEGLAENTLGPGGRDSLRYLADEVKALLEGPPAREVPFPRPAAVYLPRRLPHLLAYLERLIATARKDLPPFHQPGVHVRAYRSAYDGTLQRYVIHVPKAYRHAPKSESDPGAPVIMLAHGLHYTPEDMLRIAFGKPSGPGEAFRAGHVHTWNPPDAPQGALVVAHDGYRNGGQRPPGEVDVHAVLDDVQRAYRTNPRKVSISGFSLGGSVAFWVPLHTPTRFSASVPMCGYPNLHEYRSVKASKRRPWESRLLDEEGVVAWAESGRYLPLWMIHGTMDGPQRSELIHNRYKTLRYQSELDLPQLGHNVWDKAFEDDKVLRWLAARSRPEVAPQPVLRTARHRFNQAFWLRMDRLDRGNRSADDTHFGQLDGQLKGDRGGRIQVSTRGIAAFTILGAELGARADKPQTIVVDGKNLGEHVVGDALHLSRRNGWELVEAVDRGINDKRPGVEGPLGDVWFGPAIVVYGTQVPAEIEANRLAAERHRMHSPWIAVALPVKADVDVTDEDLIGRSVILVGRPATNLVAKRAEAALSSAGLRFVDSPRGPALELGGQLFEGPRIGISMIRPSPFDSKHYLVLHAGLGAEGTLSSRYLPEFAPDFLVYDDGLREVFGDRILSRREVLAGGFFDDQWQLPRAFYAKKGL